MVKKIQDPDIKELISVTGRPMVVPDRLKQAADFKAHVIVKGFVLDKPHGTAEFTILDGQTITIKSTLDVEYDLRFDAAKKQITIVCVDDLQVVELQEGKKIEVGLDYFGVHRGEIEFSSITSPK